MTRPTVEQHLWQAWDVSHEQCAGAQTRSRSWALPGKGTYIAGAATLNVYAVMRAGARDKKQRELKQVNGWYFRRPD